MKLWSMFCAKLLLSFVALGTLLFTGQAASAQSETTLYDFTGGTNGGAPEAGLIVDAQGHLYGTASGGGLPGGCLFSLGCGTVFELSGSTAGGWTLTTIYTFQGGADGGDPDSTLLMDGSGNLFGETLGGGGSTSTCLNVGCGTIFELSPDGSGEWTKKTLHEFLGGQDGSGPDGGLVLDAAGNLYGTTIQGGGTCAVTSAGCGIAFELIPQAGGRWKEAILHRFGISSTDGFAPSGGMVFDARGNLFGTAGSGGSTSTECGVFGCGTVFELTQNAGKWTEKTLHAFDSTDGMNPESGVTISSAGNIYGTTFQGGTGLGGLVFELTPQGSGWRFNVLHQFNSFAAGVRPEAGVVLDAVGNLYGATEFGGNDLEQCRLGSENGCGAIYELSATAFGTWKYTVLYLFSGNGDGNFAGATPVLDGEGNLYGTTIYDGLVVGSGSVFEVTP
jgi:hypothetical protein